MDINEKVSKYVNVMLEEISGLPKSESGATDFYTDVIKAMNLVYNITCCEDESQYIDLIRFSHELNLLAIQAVFDEQGKF